MNSEVKEILDTIKIGGKSVPNALFYFDGVADTFLLYSPSSESVGFAGDDRPLSSVVRFDIDVYSKKNYLALSDAVISAFIKAGWTWRGNGTDTYDEQTGLYHRLIEVEKERSVSYGE